MPPTRPAFRRKPVGLRRPVHGWRARPQRHIWLDPELSERFEPCTFRATEFSP